MERWRDGEMEGWRDGGMGEEENGRRGETTQDFSLGIIGYPSYIWGFNTFGSTMKGYFS